MNPTILLKLRKLFQVNTAPLLLAGQPRGKTISSFCLGKALVNSKNIYNRFIDKTLEETYKVVILIDASGSRTNGHPSEKDSKHITKQIIEMYYSLKIIVGKENLKIYLFNRVIEEASKILGIKIFSYTNIREFTMDLGVKQAEEANKKLCHWMIMKNGREGANCGGNHDGYALDFISKLMWWGSLPNNRKLIIHISDGRPSCDYPHCGLPGCFQSTEELEIDYKYVVKNLLENKFKLCGLGVDREMDEYYGKENCVETSEKPQKMLEDFIELFSSQIKENRRSV
jgi:hypothetical protein